MLDTDAGGRSVEVLPQHDRLVVLIRKAAVETVTIRKVVVRGRRGEGRPGVAAASRVARKVRWTGDIADIGPDGQLRRRSEGHVEPAVVVATAAARLGALIVEEVAARV